MNTMDELIGKQKETVEWIKKVSEKFTKEPKVRRTRTFIQERLDDLEFHWKEFKDRHEIIKTYKEYEEKHPYVKSKYWEQVENTVHGIRSKLVTKMSELDEEKKLAAGQEQHKKDNMQNAEQKRRIKRQEAQKQAFFRSLERMEQGGDVSKAYYTQKMSVISNLWAIISKTQNDIIENTDDDECYAELISEHEEVEQIYENVMVTLQEKVDILTKDVKSEPTTMSITQNEMKLPTIKLPTFGGDYKQWKSFIDLFKQTINKNENLGNAQKLHYLKTNLTGEAAKMIQHLQIIDSNYNTAMDMLINRYENTRLLVNAQILALLSQRECQIESAEHLRRLHDNTTECVNALKGLSIDTNSWDPMVVYIVSQKLDNETRKAYEQSLSNPKDLQSLDDFLKFLENKFHALENLEGRRTKGEHVKEQKQNYSTQKFQNREIRRPNRAYHANVTPYCRVCRGPHWLHVCNKFISMPVTQRQDVIRREKLCRNCFKGDHDTSMCTSFKRCQICYQHHHTLLHSVEVGRQVGNMQSNFADTVENTVLLATALIKTNWEGGDYYLRALIDQGSQSSFITEDAVQRLRLTKKKTFASVTGLGSTNAGTTTSKVELQIRSIHPSTFQTWATFLVLPKLTKVQPDKSFVGNRWDHIEHLSLADPSFNKTAAIDVLIGADIFQEIIIDGVIKGEPGTPIAQNTKLGWILSGSINPRNTNEISTVCNITNIELNEQLKLFWETEELQDETNLTNEEMRCEEIFKKTHKRENSGRYIVRLPFNDNKEVLGESKNRAYARFLQTEKKLVKNKQLHEDYNAFLREYIELGHMELVNYSTKPNSEIYYLPHQAVLRPESSTTKLRVVFDASSKTSSGVSLNDKMLTGPVIQQDLFSIITRWRKHKYVFRADIEKMYRQILVAQEDQDYQRILWREQPTEKMKEYRLKTVTYGTSSAPFLATRILHQLALDEEKNFKVAPKITRDDFYMDDLLSGEDTIEAAVEAQTQLTNLLARGGFKLRKWSSNAKSIMENIPPEDQEQGRFKINTYDPVKTLGIYWRPECDTFEFKINIQSTSVKLTKRIIVSETARLFDPLGWLTPVIVKAKLVQQELWRTEKSWDEILPEETINNWQEFRSELHCIEQIKIPRWNQHQSNHHVELHGFCDASERAFAAVIYTRVTKNNGEISINLLCAKSKVSPIKKVSIPRLELCGAVLLAKLIKKTTKALEIDDLEVHAWTDSKITLAWLNGNPSKWKNYVANRVENIIKIVDSTKWHHVKGSENPADCASRGINPSQLKEHLLWWNGPAWLSQSEITYDDDMHSTELEAKKINICTMMLVQERNQDIIGQMVTRYSSLTSLTRVLAYCKRYLYNLRPKNKSKKSGSLSNTELWSATKLLIKNAQQTNFGPELRDLNAGRNVEKKSKLRCLTPFIDEEGIIRVTGRLIESELSDLQKHPMIIPHNSALTTLLIDDAHKSTLHGGNALTHSYLRQQYWIINGLSAIKHRLHGCTVCFRYKADKSKQLMGNLPQPRVRRSRPFLNTGVDYAGPIDVRMSKGRGNKSYKGYIAIFICLATKAIHIEVVSDLTAHAFIAAFKRLCGRRGHVAHLYSDNGTNFVSANKILQQNIKDQEKYNRDVCNMLSSCHTEWHFIPPGAPHFGGLWEAGVKSIKYHLKRTIGEQKLTYEELSTLLTQIEACLNSRPLYPLSNNPDDPDVLTAGHFLIGTALLAPPEQHRLNEKEGLLTRWQLVERMQQQFWKKWSESYLTTLQQRQKWTQPVKNLKTGNIVLLRDENLPPTRWSLGIIENTHAGGDGLVRVVSVRTKNKIFKRPISKVCPLPIIDNYCINNEEKANNEDLKRNTNSITCLTSMRKTPERTTTYKGKINPIGFVTTLLLLLFLGGRNATALDAANQNRGIEIRPFENHPGIYFEKIADINLITSDWKLIVYYDLTNYWHEIQGFEKLVDGMSAYCRKKGSDMRLKRYNHCINLVNQFNHQLITIRNNNKLLFHQQKLENSEIRAKRSPFDFVGTVANRLFGVLDQEFAEQYEEDIGNLKRNDNHLLGLIKNQTLIADATANIIRKDEEAVAQQIHVFQNNLDLLSSNWKTANEENAAEQHFLTLSSYATLAMLSFQQTQNALLDVLTDLQHSKINLLIITPDQLRAQVRIIKNHLPPQLAVPGNKNDLLPLYKLLTVRGRITKRSVIFDIRLPLITIEDFEVFKIIPVPAAHWNEFVYIEPSADYVAVNILREAYYTMTKAEISKCSRFNNKYLCQQQHPVFNRRSNVSRCELDLLTHKKELSPMCKLRKIPPSPVWIQLNKANSWIYVLDKPYTCNLICNNLVSDITIKDDGMLTLQQNCILKQDTMTITSHNILSSEFYTAFIPATNITTLLQETPHNTSTPMRMPEVFLADGGEDVKTLQKWITDLKTHEQLPAITTSHKIHQTVSYSLIGGLFFGMILLALIMKKRERKAKTSVIELHTREIPGRRPKRRYSTSDFQV